MPNRPSMVPPEGTRLRLVDMPDDPDPVPRGSTGTVTGGSDLRDWTQIWVRWDNGRSLSLAVPPDTYEVISNAKET